MAEPKTQVEVRLDRIERALRTIIRFGALMLPAKKIKEIEDILNGNEPDE